MANANANTANASVCCPQNPQIQTLLSVKEGEWPQKKTSTEQKRLCQGTRVLLSGSIAPKTFVTTYSALVSVLFRCGCRMWGWRGACIFCHPLFLSK